MAFFDLPTDPTRRKKATKKKVAKKAPVRKKATKKKAPVKKKVATRKTTKEASAQGVPKPGETWIFTGWNGIPKPSRRGTDVPTFGEIEKVTKDKFAVRSYSTDGSRSRLVWGPQSRLIEPYTKSRLGKLQEPFSRRFLAETPKQLRAPSKRSTVAKKATKKKATKKTPVRKKVAKKKKAAGGGAVRRPRKTTKKAPSGKKSTKREKEGVCKLTGETVWTEDWADTQQCKSCREKDDYYGSEERFRCELKNERKTKPARKRVSSKTRDWPVVECHQVGRRIRVKPAAGQGYDTSKFVQFPRHLRHEGCRYRVEHLHDTGANYRAVGEIHPFESGGGAPARVSPPKPASAKKGQVKGPGAKPVMLAHKWTDRVDPTGWWVSEKLDGVRAYWDGHEFYSRAGNLFYAPDWFKKGLPETPLDGELWIGRGKFQQTVSVVRSQDMSDAWKRVRFMVFDAPARQGGIEKRLEFVKKAVRDAPHARAIKHHRCKGSAQLAQELFDVERAGGEGLVIREPGSGYEEGRRSRAFLKVKSFHDAEARVTGYYPGKGKHAGVIGGLWVETLPDDKVRGGIRFKLGTGLTDEERRSPPSIGSVVTYQFQETSDSGTPRFASYLHVRRRNNPWGPHVL